MLTTWSPRVVGDVFGRLDDVDAGVVDEHVEAAEAGHGVVDESLTAGAL